MKEKRELPGFAQILLREFGNISPKLTPTIIDLAGKIWDNERTVVEFILVDAKRVEAAKAVHDPVRPFMLAEEEEYIIG